MNKFCKECGAKVLGAGLCQNCNTFSAETKSDNNGVFYTNTVLDNTNHITPVGKADLKGLGGWLIVVCLGLIYTFFTAITGVYLNWSMFQDGTVASLSEISGYSTLMGIELIVYVVIVILIGYLFLIFFKKKKDFPRFFIYYAIFIVAFAILDFISLNSLSLPGGSEQLMQEINSESMVVIVRNIVFALVWVSYMKKSERVKLTFIE